MFSRIYLRGSRSVSEFPPRNGLPGLVAFAWLSLAIAAAQAPNPADAVALEQQGRLAEAARVWQAVTQQNPNDAAAFASLGAVLSKQQKYQEAASSYRKALALDAKLPGVNLNLGLAEFKQGHFQRAITPFRSALAVDPSNVQARILLGLSYYGAKRFTEAINYL